MKKTIDDHVNPAHYKEIIPGYEYMDMMEYMLADFQGVRALSRTLWVKSTSISCVSVRRTLKYRMPRKQNGISTA